MKKVLYMFVVLGMLVTLSEAKWLNLSSAQINAFGSGLNKNGVDHSDEGRLTIYERAKKICRRAGGRVPSVRDFKRLASRCGFRITEFGGQRLSKKATKCLEKKGFYDSGAVDYYWTSNSTYSGYKITVDLTNLAYSASSPYGQHTQIRCIK